MLANLVSLFALSLQLRSPDSLRGLYSPSPARWPRSAGPKLAQASGLGGGLKRLGLPGNTRHTSCYAIHIVKRQQQRCRVRMTHATIAMRRDEGKGPTAGAAQPGQREAQFHVDTTCDGEVALQAASPRLLPRAPSSDTHVSMAMGTVRIALAISLAALAAANSSCDASSKAHSDAVDACKVTLLSELYLSERIDGGAIEICSVACRDAINKLKTLTDDCQPVQEVDDVLYKGALALVRSVWLQQTQVCGFPSPWWHPVAREGSGMLPGRMLSCPSLHCFLAQLPACMHASTQTRTRSAAGLPAEDGS